MSGPGGVSLHTMGINVLSLFDGMSCGRVALERAGIEVDNYYASETDKYAIQVSQKNYPDIVRLGNVEDWMFWDLPKIDLLLGGSPCQGFSFAGRQLNFEDPRSRLFFDFVDIKDHIKPGHFLLENVVMKQAYQDVITERLGVRPIEINSALVSAQNRRRLYWVDFEITQPEDRGVSLRDILIDGSDQVYQRPRGKNLGGIRRRKSPSMTSSAWQQNVQILTGLTRSAESIAYMDRKVADGRTYWDFKHHSDTKNDKAAALVANLFKGVPYNVLRDRHLVRKFHPVECERLQTLPDDYTEGVSNTQRYKMLGNGWTIDVIAHIFECMYLLN